MKLYERAQDGFEAVLTRVRADQWERPSACTEWTVRDVAGHVIWGQEQLRAWATGVEYDRGEGAPGATRPGVLTGPDPLATWRAARAATDQVLTPEALARTTTLTGMGEIPVAAVLDLLVTDLVAHTWDIGYPLGLAVAVPSELVTAADDWAHAHMVRAPGFFGPEVTPPGEADDQTRMLAYLGRTAWAPVPA